MLPPILVVMGVKCKRFTPAFLDGGGEMKQQRETLTPREAAQRLGIGLDSVYSLLWSGKLPARKVDGRWIVNPSDVAVRLKSKEARRGNTGR